MKKAFTLVELIVVITILAILGTIAFISLQGYSKEARDGKRLSDTRNILNKINIEQTKGTDLSLLITGATETEGQILGVANSEYHTFGVANFEVLREQEANLKDPLNKTQDYPMAYAIGGTGTGAYKFTQIATISEKENKTKIMGNYYKQEIDDIKSLFEKDGYIYNENDNKLIYEKGDGSIDNGGANTDFGGVEVWTDPMTGYNWQKNPTDTTYKWALRTSYTEPTRNSSINDYDYPTGNSSDYPAFAYCTSLGGGKKGWRLPTKEELEALINKTDPTNPNGAKTNHPTLTTNYYWSGTVSADYTTNAWYVYFTNGNTTYNSKTFSYRVVCIHD